MVLTLNDHVVELSHTKLIVESVLYEWQSERLPAPVILCRRIRGKEKTNRDRGNGIYIWNDSWLS